MEYFLGVATTLTCMFFLNMQVSKLFAKKIPIPQFTQSRSFNLTKQAIISIINDGSKQKTQSSEYLNKHNKKGIVFDKTVYWIDNGFLVSAEIENGKIDYNTQKRVDTHTMDGVELDKIMFIVQKLSEEKNDSSDSGN